ncbi:MAG: sulfatase-like hydrolase/transferase, partial [Chloroflexi bacterium]|nr:sulfatase-like hydrolase/transferase [Chloroflexota bacterium]
PFRRWKRETYRGGISDPFIVHYPKGIQAKDAVRQQYTHAIDMVPTVLDLLNLEPPASIKGVTQSPIEGVSFAHTLENADAPGQRTTQYFEMLGHRSIYHNGWKAVCPWPGPSFAEAGTGFGNPISAEKLTELDENHWELYHVAEDFAENHNVAAENRSKLIEMIAQWYVEAGKYNVLPIDGRGAQRVMDERPAIAVGRTSYTYYPDTQPVSASAGANVMNRPHSIIAEVDIPAEGAEGVIFSHGGSDGGYSLYMKEGKLHYVHNYVAREYFHVESVEKVPSGHHQVRFEFEVTGQPDFALGKGSPGRAQLYFDGKLVGNADFPYTTPFMFGVAGGALECGRDSGAPITPEYAPPFEFTGEIDSVTVDVSGELIRDTKAEIRVIMARQ